MKNKDTFSEYNPIINFVFFIGAVVLGMFFVHPAFLACSFAAAFSYYLTVRGGRGLKLIFALLPVFVLVAVLNPLFSPYGDTVLFFYLGDRPYTLEGLYYGIALGAMFVAVMGWFASYSLVMTGDKFLYIFGRLAPSISLVLSMILRLIPTFQRKIGQIAGARKCIGKAGHFGTKKEKVENGMTVLSALTSWALEGGIITADSMRSRGYGSGRRTAFAIYRFDGRDKLMMVLMPVLMAAVIFCSAKGGTAVTYVPSLEVAGADNAYTVLGLIFYTILLFIPTVLNVAEAITWRILRSRI